jgi:hypothetical protein
MMTSPARITHEDFERSALAAAAAAERLGSVARLIYRLEEREIEIVLDEALSTAPTAIANRGGWEEEL